jgi:hypothetical protein
MPAKTLLTFLTATLCCLPALPTLAQGAEIQEIPFESIPGDVTVVTTEPIILDSDTGVTGNFSSNGSVEAQTEGFYFPDGTLQSTAAFTTGVSANNGLYNNRIVEMTPPLPYTEVCFKSGSVSTDIHSVSEPTTGGSCVPGDLGWIIERDERTAQPWELAKVECLLLGMRLPEAFEYLYSCINSGSFGLNDMTGAWKWASNTATSGVGTTSYVGVSVIGSGSCHHGSVSSVGRSDGGFATLGFRCLR